MNVQRAKPLLRSHHRAGMIALLIAGLAVPLTGAEVASRPASAPAPAELDPEYVDGSFGFAVRPFAGATLLRQKKVLDVADVEIVQFVRVEDRWSLAVRQTATTRPLDAATMIEGITASLVGQHTDVRQIRGEEARIASREGVRYAASFSIQGVEWLRQQAVIRTKPLEYFTLVLITPLNDRDAALPVFDRIVDSFKVLRTDVSERQLKAALERGTALLQSVAQGGARLSEKIVPETYLRFIIDGKEAGYIQLRERKRTQGARTGVEVRGWGWLFRPDGSITHLRQEMYLTDDLSNEQWENRVLMILPARDGQREQVLLEIESGLREEDQLIVAYTPEPNSSDLVDKVLDVEKSYASAAWNTLVPRVLDLSRAESYAFSSYDAERRGLVLRAFRVVGPTRVTLDGVSTRAIKIEDSEGFLPPINEIDVDSKGRVLRVQAGALEMVATTREQIELKYTSTVAAAQAILNRIPVREPTPAPRERPEDPTTPARQP